MANYEGTKYNFDGANLTDIEGVPTATIVPWSDSSVPSGYLECNGQAVSRSTYSALFAIVGTTYGAGDGSSTFLVPNLSDNVAIGKSNNKTLGSAGGANTVASSGNISGSTANATLSTPQLASHTHSPHGWATDGTGTRDNNPNSHPYTSYTADPATSSSTGSGGGHAHNMSANFSGDATSVLQPYLTVMYLIKT
jgi:microcystin-dependent protein